MPWKQCHVVDERVRFVRRLLEGETMTALCQEFGISRKTGYKIFQRYQQIGVRGLSDRSRRPYRYANQLPEAVEAVIVRLKKLASAERWRAKPPRGHSQNRSQLQRPPFKSRSGARVKLKQNFSPAADISRCQPAACMARSRPYARP